MNVLNSYNQLFSSELQSPPPDGKISSVSEAKTPKKIDKKKLACSVSAAIGIVALFAAGIYLGKIKPKNTVEQITDITQDGIGKLLKENDKLTGKFSKTLKDGSKVVIEYSDGVLQKSTKTAADGTQIFEKVYSRTVSGDLLVNNKNITEISNQAKKHQEDFINLIKKQDSSLDELQSFDRKNLSKKQIGELDGKIKAKQKIELEVKKDKEVQELVKQQSDISKKIEFQGTTLESSEIRVVSPSDVDKVDGILFDPNTGNEYTGLVKTDSDIQEYLNGYLVQNSEISDKTQRKHVLDFLKEKGLHTGKKVEEFPCIKTITCGDGEVIRLAYEGDGYDITTDGRILKKVYADWYLALVKREKNIPFTYAQDVTEEIYSQINRKPRISANPYGKRMPTQVPRFAH